MRKSTKTVLFAAVALASASAMAAEVGDTKTEAVKPQETPQMMHGEKGMGGMVDMMQRMNGMMDRCNDMMAMMRKDNEAMPPHPKAPGNDH